MQYYKNLYVLGTSHISIDSINQVTRFIEENKPEIVAIELDRNRLKSLFHKQEPRISDMMQLGVKSFLINLIGHYIEKKLGKMVGVSPGSEMKTAVKLAKKHNLKLALIDQDITITLKKLSKSITWKEKFRFLKDILKGLILRKSDMPQFDLKKVPPKKLINMMMKKVKQDYPNVYNVLIEERNNIMSENLFKLMNINEKDKIFAIVGAGHEEDIIKIIKRK